MGGAATAELLWCRVSNSVMIRCSAASTCIPAAPPPPAAAACERREPPVLAGTGVLWPFGPQPLHEERVRAAKWLIAMQSAQPTRQAVLSAGGAVLRSSKQRKCVHTRANRSRVWAEGSRSQGRALVSSPASAKSCGTAGGL